MCQSPGSTVRRQSSIQAERAGGAVAVAGLAVGAAGDFLGEMEAAGGDVRDGEVGEFEIVHEEAGGAGGRVEQDALAEPSDLVAEFPAIGGVEGAGEVPPFRLESGMGAVVAGELIMPAGKGDLPAIGRGARGE